MRRTVKSALGRLRVLPGRLSTLASAHVGRAFGRPTRFSGLYPTRQAALAALPDTAQKGYDDEDIAEVSLEAMSQLRLWDYPVVLWLDRLMSTGETLIDAGGHLGTKATAFAPHLGDKDLDWCVYDLPGIVRAAQVAQAAGRIDPSLRFFDRLEGLPPARVLLASGLLQYIDRPFFELVADLPERPEFIIANKVALREGPTAFTLERIGKAQVPYRMRSVDDWTVEIEAAAYRIADSWRISELDHVIPTHPWQPPSNSWGYVLEKAFD